MNQKGFATLEVILMIVVIGILASVAVPRFTDTTTKANTAKIQADLSTLDTAIDIYYMENGKYPDSISDLSDYVKDVDSVKPPTGKAYVEGAATNISAKTYNLNGDKSRATLDEKTAGKFYYRKDS